MKRILSLVTCLVFLGFSGTSFANSVSDASANASAGAVAVGGITTSSALTGPSSAELNYAPVTNVENVNRQFLPAPIVSGPTPQNYFGPWQLPKTPWNIFPLEKREFSREEVKILARGARIDKKNFKFFVSLEPQDKIVVTDKEPTPNLHSVTRIGYGVVRGKENSVSYEVLGVLMKEALKKGANVLVVKNFAWQQKSRSGGWHIGFGAGAGGIIDGEKVAISGASGTGFGNSSVTTESMPWIQAVFYRDGVIKPDGEIKSQVPEEKRGVAPELLEEISPIH